VRHLAGNPRDCPHVGGKGKPLVVLDRSRRRALVEAQRSRIVPIGIARWIQRRFFDLLDWR
jgi:hypothetical protein